MTIEESYNNFDYSLTIALECSSFGPRQTPESLCTAKGNLYDEESDQLISLNSIANSTRGTFIIDSETDLNCTNTKGLITTVVIYGTEF